jgi:hypothetical protein
MNGRCRSWTELDNFYGLGSTNMSRLTALQKGTFCGIRRLLSLAQTEWLRRSVALPNAKLKRRLTTESHKSIELTDAFEGKL